jgi:FkbM family methyltransferase
MRHNRHVAHSRKSGVKLNISFNKKIYDQHDNLVIPDYNHWVYYQKGISERRKKLLGIYTQGLIKLSANDTVVDVGANVGDFSHEISSLVNQVVAIEPDPNIFPCLSYNLRMLPNMKLHRVAVGPKCTEQVFYTAPKTNDSSFIKTDGVSYTEVIVSVVRLDVLLQEFDNIKLLKCDAEGFEPEVISSIEGIVDKIHYISVDCSEERNGQSTMKEVTELIDKYKFTILNDYFDGRKIIVAKNQRL